MWCRRPWRTLRTMKHESKTMIAIASLALVLAGACAGDDRTHGATATTSLPAGSGTTAASSDVTAALTAVVRDIIGNDASIPGLLLHLEAPDQGVDVSVAGGLDDR